MEISPYKFNLPGADPKPDYVHVVSYNGNKKAFINWDIKFDVFMIE